MSNTQEMTFSKLSIREDRMAKIRCGYCGKEYDETWCTALDNGSPACPECVAKEEENKKTNEKEGNDNE